MKKLVFLLVVLASSPRLMSADVRLISTAITYSGLGTRGTSLDRQDIGFINSKLREMDLRQRSDEEWLVVVVPDGMENRILFIPLFQGYELNGAFRDQILDKILDLINDRLKAKDAGRGTDKK